MKLYIVILLYCSFLHPQSQENIPAEIKEEIDKGIDYYNLSLYEDSKKIFLDLLYSDDGKKYEAEIRYHLGLSSLYERNYADAKIQWKMLIKKFPTHKRSRELSRTADRWESFEDERESNKEENREFADDKGFGLHFWDYKAPDAKLLYGELKDAGVAVKYYEKMYDNYDDPSKKFQISVRLFALYAGFNQNDFGYKNQSTYGTTVSEDPYKSLSLGQFAQKAQAQLREMENTLTGEFDVNNSSFIMWNYLWAVKLSDSQFWSEKAKSNSHSEPYFAKVISLTNAEPNNIYRLFSIMYLGDNAEKYVVSDEQLAKYESFGLTANDLIGLSRREIPSEYWVEINQRNFDLSLIVNVPSFIRSIKLEKLLKKYNLISTYSFEDLQSDIQNINKWSTLFLSPNPPTSNEELMSFINKSFNCADIDCFTKNKNVIKQNIVRELKGGPSRQFRDNQLFVTLLPISALVIIKKNNISAEDFAKLYANERKVFWQ